MFIGLRAVKMGSEHVHLEPENIRKSMHFPSNKACQHIDFQGVWFIDFLILLMDFQADFMFDFDSLKAYFLIEILISKINF